MAKNDKVLLDGVIDDRITSKIPSGKRDEVFEFLAFEQILKDFDLSHDEILSGSIDGRQDGGIDGFFILVNGHLVQDPESFSWPRTNSDLKVYLISCKHHDTFKQATLDALISSLTELLDFSNLDSDLRGAYSASLLAMRGNLQLAYRKLSPRLTNFSVFIYYASRGDTREVGDEVLAKSRQLEFLVSDYFGSCKSLFTFMGSTELIELHRKKPNYTLELPFVEALSKGERYVVLTRLSDYYEFTTDNGKLRRYLFDSNVRDFMGPNRVNEDIKSTLEEPSSPDFWWLNNGVTILATSASIIGKSILASDIQIVNGLQTTESIYRHFHKLGSAHDDRCILVKVIVSNDDATRDSIIRATNNQTDVELASLHATDKIQRDIEEVLLRNGFYYERRKNFYVNLGHIPAEIVTPLYVAAGCIALVHKIPYRASTLRSRFMRSSEAYDSVFSEKLPIEVWPKIAAILKTVDLELEKLRPTNRATDKFLKGWRYIIAFFIVSDHFKTYAYSPVDLASFDVSKINSISVEKVWAELNEYPSVNSMPNAWNLRRDVVSASRRFGFTHGISGVEAVKIPNSPLVENPSNKESLLTKDFLDIVFAALPPQPWKPGLHKIVSAKLNCSTSTYFAAVNKLIKYRRIYRQKDGVLYDHEGNVTGFDSERVDPETLMLNK